MSNELAFFEVQSIDDAYTKVMYLQKQIGKWVIINKTHERKVENLMRRANNQITKEIVFAMGTSRV